MLNIDFIDFFSEIFYNFSMNKTINCSLREKVKMYLAGLGIEEKYIAFTYLVEVMLSMLFSSNDESTYNDTIHRLSQEYSITETTIKNSLSQIVKTCPLHISSHLQFNLKRNSTLNKIRVIIRYFIDNCGGSDKL